MDCCWRYKYGEPNQRWRERSVARSKRLAIYSTAPLSRLVNPAIPPSPWPARFRCRAPFTAHNFTQSKGQTTELHPSPAAPHPRLQADSEKLCCTGGRGPHAHSQTASLAPKLPAPLAHKWAGWLLRGQLIVASCEQEASHADWVGRRCLCARWRCFCPQHQPPHCDWRSAR